MRKYSLEQPQDKKLQEWEGARDGSSGSADPGEEVAGGANSQK